MLSLPNGALFHIHKAATTKRFDLQMHQHNSWSAFGTFAIRKHQQLTIVS